MSTVLAAIDDSAAARTVLETAVALADVLGATTDALHVREDHSQSPRRAADAACVPLREVTGDVVDQIAGAAASADVSAVVIGVRCRPAARQPAGHVALALMTDITKPLMVVPPHVRTHKGFRRMAVPLDGTLATAARARPAIDLAAAAGIDVVVIHVSDEDRIPPFTEQPQHETRAFAEEFLARYAPGTSVRLELRVGVPAAEVLDAAVALDADLCALAWAQGLEPGRAQVIKELLTHSPIPLLLLPLDGLETSAPPS